MSLQADPYARSLKSKTFPFYADWIDIFSNDRANGSDAQAFTDAVQDVINKEDKQQDMSTGVDEVGDPPVVKENTTSEFQSFTRGESSSGIKDKGKRKRKNLEGMDEYFMETMTNFCDKTENRIGQIADTMGDIAQRIGIEFDATKKRGPVYESLGVLDFLTIETKVNVAQYLCNNSKELDLYFSLPEEAKAVMVIKKHGLEGI